MEQATHRTMLDTRNEIQARRAAVLATPLTGVSDKQINYARDIIAQYMDDYGKGMSDPMRGPDAELATKPTTNAYQERADRLARFQRVVAAVPSAKWWIERSKLVIWPVILKSDEATERVIAKAQSATP